MCSPTDLFVIVVVVALVQLSLRMLANDSLGKRRELLSNFSDFIVAAFGQKTIAHCSHSLGVPAFKVCVPPVALSPSPADAWFWILFRFLHRWLALKMVVRVSMISIAEEGEALFCRQWWDSGTSPELPGLWRRTLILTWLLPVLIHERTAISVQFMARLSFL